MRLHYNNIVVVEKINKLFNVYLATAYDSLIILIKPRTQVFTMVYKQFIIHVQLILPQELEIL